MGAKNKNKEQVKLAKKEKQDAKAAKKLAKDSNETAVIELVNAMDENAVSLGADEKGAPEPRTSFTFLLTKNGFVVFGGEQYDSKVCKVFNDCYRWNPGKVEDQWKQGATAGSRPKPRVGHASCVFNDMVYISGGEFATHTQFYHFRDFWRLDPRTLTWEELPAIGGPPSRSGHRLTVSRNLLLSFGGFNDAGREVRYFNDLYSFTPSDGQWRKLNALKPPPPRSAAVVAANADGLLVSGGFSKTKDTDRDCKGTYHDDLWWLDLTPIFGGAVGSADQSSMVELGRKPELTWTKLKKRALTRAGLAYCQHKNLIYAFGGVIDNDAGGNSYNSSFFFNDVWTVDLTHKQWTKLKIAEGAPESGNGTVNVGAPVLAYRPGLLELELVVLDVDLMKKLASEAEAKKNHERSKDRKKKGGKKSALLDDAPEFSHLKDAGILNKLQVAFYNANPRSLREPMPRANAAIAVKDGYLYLYGGSIEIGSKNLLYDDAWRLNLKTATWECLIAGKYWENSVAQGECVDSSTDDDDEDLTADEENDSDQEDMTDGHSEQEESEDSSESIPDQFRVSG